MRSDLVKDLVRLAASAARREVSGLAQRVHTAAAFRIVAALAMVCGLVFLLAAAFVLAAERWGAAPAALGFGTLFVALSIAVYGVGALAQRRHARALERQREADGRVLTDKAAQAIVDLAISRAGGSGLLLAPLIVLAGSAILRDNGNAGETRPKPGAIDDRSRRDMVRTSNARKRRAGDHRYRAARQRS